MISRLLATLLCIAALLFAASSAVAASPELSSSPPMPEPVSVSHADPPPALPYTGTNTELQALLGVLLCAGGIGFRIAWVTRKR